MLACQIRVPASTANLGPGFDIFGLALGLYNDFSIQAAAKTTIQVDGPAGTQVPTDESNLFYRTWASVFKEQGEPIPPVAIQMTLNVPLSRGLGSSATAVVGGLMAAHFFLDQHPTRGDLALAAWRRELGQHPDNVTAAIYGGFLVNVTDDAGHLITTELPWPEELKAVCYIPEFKMDTVAGRQLMPTHYPTADVVFTSSHVALLMTALQLRQFELLDTAMRDRMHQPYREQIFPAMPTIIQAAVKAGAHGAALSGGGATVLALATGETEPIRQAMESAASTHGLRGKALELPIDLRGAKLTPGAVQA